MHAGTATLEGRREEGQTHREGEIERRRGGGNREG